MIGVGVIDRAGLGIFGYDQKHDSRPIPEEVDRLNVAGIVKAAGFIGGDQNRGRIPYIGVGLHGLHNVLYEASNIAGVEVPGWPSTMSSGLMYETAGSVLFCTSVKKEVMSTRLFLRSVVMMDLEYWKGLQMSQ